MQLENKSIYQSLLSNEEEAGLLKQHRNFKKLFAGVALSLGLVVCFTAYFRDSNQISPIEDSQVLKQQQQNQGQTSQNTEDEDGPTTYWQSGVRIQKEGTATNELFMCEDKNFQKTCHSYYAYEGQAPRVINTELSRMYTAVSIGTNVRVEFCYHKNCEGSNSFHYFEMVGPLIYSHLGDQNDDVSAIRIQYYNESVNPAVMAFSRYNWGLGHGATFDVGQYNKDQMEDEALRNDDIDCIYVPKGRTVTLYTDDNFKGDEKVYTGPIEVPKLPGGIYDKVSSLIVEDTFFTRIRGYWKQFDYQISPGSLQATYKLTKTYSQSETHTESFQIGLSQEISAEFAGVESTTTLEFGYQWGSEYSTQMSYSEETTHQFNCPAKDGQWAIGIFIWYMDGYQGDYMANGTRTVYNVCRYDDLASVPPNCPWSECAGDQCIECNIQVN